MFCLIVVSSIHYEKMSRIRTRERLANVLTLSHTVMLQVFAIQPLAEIILLAPGAAFDTQFPFAGTAAGNFATDLYFDGGVGDFQANYFLTNLQNRGLVNSPIGPDLPHFPFYEDASVIHDAIRTFMASFVGSYYSSDDVVTADSELQSWVVEANGAAEAIDFPSTVLSTDTIVDVLTHVVSFGRPRENKG